MKIFIAPLDWGLGHATRCMPIIDYLLSQGVEVVIGGDGRSLALLRHQYPGLISEELPGYNVTYAGSYGFFGKIAVQIPKVVRTTRAEHAALHALVQKHHFDGIISDNRYGVWHPQVPSVAVLHQLAPDLPGPLRLLRKVLYDFHLFFLRHFDQLWIPDASGEDNLSGELSHKYPLPDNARFLGVLSRLRGLAALDTLPGFPQVLPRQADIVAVLSGPEPQRSILEQKIVSQARGLDRSVWIIQGKTEERTYRQEGNLHFFSFLNAQELATVLRRAQVILSRGGYTSLMDFAALGCKHMILVPTPGQTEQLYLAQRLEDQGMAIYEQQESFDLKRALGAVAEIEGFFFPAQHADPERIISPWLQSLKKNSPADLEN